MQLLLFKICRTCLEAKTPNNFIIAKTTSDGFRSDCKGCLSLIKKQKYKTDDIHRNKVIESSKKWIKQNRMKIKEREKEFYKKNPQKEKLLNCFRQMGKAANFPSDKIIKLIGCSGKDFRAKIESSFLSGMSWDNRTLWTFEGVIPFENFDLTKKKERYKAFNHQNIKLKWRKQNAI